MSSQSKGEPRWVSKKAALAICERLLAEHGGAWGIRDEGSLEAALAAPRNHFYYSGPDLFTLAAVHAHAVTRNRPFLDGNKRVALTLAGVFLKINGLRLLASERDAVAATFALSNREIGFEEFAAWLRDNSKKVPVRRKPGR
ncbi:MAG TPA: type II toxin-antitoxin system death-on-curing family toxin [Candidatus Binatia bacterium]|nr:type II toxin-antitoxin system death-on-curing family toxin [Candidatus Binatia bacterium]